MNRYQFFIEDNGTAKEIDVENLDFSTLFSVSDLSNIGARKDNITLNLEFKGTKNNNMVFGDLYNIGRYTDNFGANMLHNYKPNKKVRCYVFENNIQTIMGNLITTDVAVSGDDITYQCIITGDVVSFMGSLDDRVLTDLTSLKDFLHTYDYDTIEQSWSTGSHGYIYPMINYGINYRSGGNTYDIYNYRTAIFLKTYFDAIFRGFDISASGEVTQPQLPKFIWNGEIKTDPLFLNAFIPHNEELFTLNRSGVFATGSGSGQQWGGDDNWYPAKVNLTFTGSDVVATRVQDIEVRNSVYQPYDILYFKQPTQTSIKISINFKLDWDWDGSLGTGLYKIGVMVPKNLYVDSDLITSFSVNLNGVNDGNRGERHYDAVFELPFGTYDSTGLTLAVIQTKTVARARFATTINRCTVELGSKGVTSIVPVSIGDTISLYDVLPKSIKIKEFVKSIISMYNLYIIVNPDNENEFLVQTHDDFYNKSLNPKVHAKNWTDKIDFNSYTINSNVDIPKTYNFKYKDDSDYLNEDYKKKHNDTYGNFTINDSQGLSESKDIEIIFSPTIVRKSLTDDKSIPIIYKLNGASIETFKSNVRILVFNGIASCMLYSVNYDTGYSLRWYPYCSNVFVQSGQIVASLLFGAPKEKYSNEPISNDMPTLYNRYYKNQMNELTDSNLITFKCDAYLNELDIGGLDFRIPVFISSRYGSAYFKLLEITYRNSESPSALKLQKIII